ncbi:sodium/proline symporter PutP [Corynebacterium pygosceleis]|uniref:sodium/proline symporter PutP n=1 Tax=Corynebacterium pygosceleis TaxID=2800406 RepID=UPI001904A09C|nr:sodium/proline symporter PutP [Corynebacterium pygosceleis]MCL0120944.1 sodium/proline symporter PutP [Corynebacterium pygosceleis]
MAEQTWFVIAIVIYMLVMLAIGFWGFGKTDEYDDYVLAGRGLNPFVAALSAGASDMSGWLLMGLPGALFVTGFSELWIAIGLLVGCWANWFWVAPRLRSYTEVANNSITIPSFVENRLRDKSHTLRIICSLIILVFFTFYVSAGMVAGGKYFQATFDGDYHTGLLIVAVVTVIYTVIGGFLAVCYTDAVQGMIMFAALLIVPVMALFVMNDPGSIFTWATTREYGPWTDGELNTHYFSMITGVSFAAIIGNLAWGLGYFGQPHIIVRFMALSSPKEAKSGRRIGIGWMLLCVIGAAAVALIGTSFFGQDPNIAITDRDSYETIFLDMARILFHPLIAGLVLTAVLAAIMSTISSQLLVTSSALIEDLLRLFHKRPITNQKLVYYSRTAVVGVAVIATLLAWNPDASILGLVGFAWAGFGSAFGPVVIASLYWRRLNTPGAIAGMASGALVSFFWGRSPLGDVLYEMVPGFLVATVVMVVVSLLTAPPSRGVTREFDEAARLAKLADENPELAVEEVQAKAEKGEI